VGRRRGGVYEALGNVFWFFIWIGILIMLLLRCRPISWLPNSTLMLVYVSIVIHALC
jgi:hypothetical protein